MNRNPLALAVELGLVAALFWADARGLVPVSKTPFLVLLAAVSLHFRGRPWSAVGWRRPPRWSRAILFGLAAGLAIELLELLATKPVLERLTGEVANVSVLRPIVGNVAYLALAVVLAWTLAALGEELFWRGYFLDRLARLGAGRAWSFIALVLMSLAFGLAHFAQGLPGVAENTLDGFWLGLVYLASGRNLVAPIIAHGVTDTLDVTLVFLGRYPGV